jgi:hypothetical protein
MLYPSFRIIDIVLFPRVTFIGIVVWVAHSEAVSHGVPCANGEKRRGLGRRWKKGKVGGCRRRREGGSPPHICELGDGFLLRHRGQQGRQYCHHSSRIRKSQPRPNPRGSGGLIVQGSLHYIALTAWQLNSLNSIPKSCMTAVAHQFLTTSSLTSSW